MAGAGGAARRGAAWRCLDENRWWNGVPADAPGCDAAVPASLKVWAASWFYDGPRRDLRRRGTAI